MNSGEIAVTIVGHLTAVPELRITKSGKAVANFTIAENHRKFVDGNFEDDGETFVKVTVWNHLAENVIETFPEKGMPILAYGTLRINRWKDDNGVNRDSAEVTAIAVGPNLQFATADVKRPQKKWGGKNMADVVSDASASETSSKVQEETETKAESTDDAKGSETSSKAPSQGTRKTASKAETKS